MPAEPPAPPRPNLSPRLARRLLGPLLRRIAHLWRAFLTAELRPELAALRHDTLAATARIAALEPPLASLPPRLDALNQAATGLYPPMAGLHDAMQALLHEMSVLRARQDDIQQMMAHAAADREAARAHDDTRRAQDRTLAAALEAALLTLAAPPRDPAPLEPAPQPGATP